MKEFVFLFEEASAKAMLEGLMPRLHLGKVQVRYIVFEGKQDLEGSLVKRLKGYKNKNAFFIILRDQGSGDCLAIKQSLVVKCKEAGKPKALVRIACRELESWYLADLAAVEQGLSIPQLRSHQKKSKFHNPDALSNAAEELTKLTEGAYQKIAGYRAIGYHLDLDNSRSRSFANLIAGLRGLFQSPPQYCEEEGPAEPPNPNP